MLVVEDTTELLRAQRQLAWKEVAQRVAHEIKNPLTPIALSAERIGRHLDRGQADSPNDHPQVQRGDSGLRGHAAHAGRSVLGAGAVSRAAAAACDMNAVVEEALALFAGRLEGITVQRDLEPGLPTVLADPEAIRRALANLIDNAAEAMQGSLLRVLGIHTALSEDGAAVEIAVSDTGHGLTDEIRERLFLPFYSTKNRGTGLGLSIAAKIVQEHGGSIRAEANSPKGARFLLRLPLMEPQRSQRRRDAEPQRGDAADGAHCMNHILVVDDEAEIRNSLEEILREEGYGVAGAASAGEALVLLQDVPYDVVLLDIWLPDRDGLDVLADIRQMAQEARPEVVIISGHGTIEAAVKATKLGAYDFLEKPLSLERTLIVFKNAVEARRLRTENEEFKRQFSVGSVLTGESVPVKALRQQIRLMAPTNGRVLIYGESGTGKELIARSIHAESLRRDRVFVELNCAAIPEAHIEAELFGYRHGAQPGGPPEQRGTLERADGGTLFLDEVGDMSLKTQAKVLSALDDQMFTPVGGTQPLRVDVRLIASTNKDLEEEIAKGNFREDLFYRLNVVPFFVPPLRERKQDIPLLAREFLAEFGRQYGRPRMEIGDEALEALAQYHWPGNVRELKNVIERVLILNPRVLRIERKHLPPLTHKAGTRSTEEFSSLQQARDAYEREYILKKIEEAHNNISHAAELLGLERSHLYRKMKALGIDGVRVELERRKRPSSTEYPNLHARARCLIRAPLAFQLPHRPRRHHLAGPHQRRARLSAAQRGRRSRPRGQYCRAASVPHAIYFLWGPVTDFWMRRRTWLIDRRRGIGDSRFCWLFISPGFPARWRSRCCFSPLAWA